VTRGRAGLWAIGAVALALVVAWVARNTYWEDLKVPMPPKGEARINPFYAAQRFAEQIGAHASWDRMFTAPSSNAVIVLSGWHWSIGRARRASLEQWVESGGRLVVDDMLVDPAGEFERWSTVLQTFPEKDEEFKKGAEGPSCREVREEFGSDSADRTVGDTFVLCDVGISWLESGRPPEWALRDKTHLQSIRVRIGRGSVTVVNAEPFRYRELFKGDHARLLVAAAQLRRGDEVHFVSEDDYPSLLALTWRHGAPVVAIGLTLATFLLWRGAVRFGPLSPPPSRARRSLADQIRGTGRFALLHGGGRALHAACVRALDEAARRRISRYAVLTPEERSAALARVTGFDRDSLAAAIHHPGLRTGGELHRTLALLEAARRDISRRQKAR
jgi:hypothetical protein